MVKTDWSIVHCVADKLLAEVSNNSIIGFSVECFLCLCCLCLFYMFIEDLNGTFQFIIKMSTFLIFCTTVNGLYKTTAEAGLSHCTWQSVAEADKTAGTAFAFVFIFCVFAYSRE